MAIIPSPFCAKCPNRAVAVWSHPEIPDENIAGMELSLCARHDADWAPRYAGTRWTRTSLTGDPAPRAGRTCNKHGTPQWCPDGVCPYCEPGGPKGATPVGVLPSHTPTVQLHACDYKLPRDVAERMKRLSVDRPMGEGTDRVKLSWRWLLLNPGDTYAGRRIRCVVHDDEWVILELEPRQGPNSYRFWSSKMQQSPPPTREQMLAHIDKAFRAPPRPPGPVIVSPELGAALLAQELRCHEPSPEECAAWAVCEFLHWGATRTPVICSCGCGLDIG